jgi:DNA-binding HxlR family transcriptional regulator
VSNVTLDDIASLARQRWAVAVIARLAAPVGGRFAVLLHRLPISRESLTRTLQALIVAGWIIRNPGYGHPLRPEYVLTERGQAVALTCVAIDTAQKSLNLAPASLSRWSLPIVRVVADGARRFGEIERGLPLSNPRALTQSLKALVGQDLLSRTVMDAYPPVADYTLSTRGARLATALMA